jgi:N-alpha-acetyltransferase 40
MDDNCDQCAKRRKALEEGKIVEATNSMHISDFFQTFYSNLWLQGQLAKVAPGVCAIWANAESLGNSLDECFELVEETSAEAYRNSDIKWSPSKKKKEMRLPDMRYIILAAASPSTGQCETAGFVSFMITYENGHEVIYCYEIHLAEQWRGKGIGKKLMMAVEDIGMKVGVKKSMLTVFKSNKHALQMYERLGYVEDEFSPSARTLRNGRVREPTYRILSKGLNRK